MPQKAPSDALLVTLLPPTKVTSLLTCNSTDLLYLSLNIWKNHTVCNLFCLACLNLTSCLWDLAIRKAHLFPLLHYIPLCERSTIYLSSLLLIGIGVPSSLGLSRMVLLRTPRYISFGAGISAGYVPRSRIAKLLCLHMYSSNFSPLFYLIILKHLWSTYSLHGTLLGQIRYRRASLEAYNLVQGSAH